MPTAKLSDAQAINPRGGTAKLSDAQAITAPPPESDTRNSFQKGVDSLIRYVGHPEDRGEGQPNAANHFGEGLLGGTAGVIAHPIEAAKGAVHSALPDKGAAGFGEMMLGPVGPTAVHMAQSLIHHPAETAGGLVGGAALGEAGGMLLHGVATPMMEGGGALVDRAAGTLKSDFSHSAKPGASYLEGGGTPAFTMRGLANKADAVKDAAGQKLGEAYDASTAAGTKIPSSPVSDALIDPVNKLRRIQNGPGGVGASPMLDEYENGVRQQPGTDFTPRSLFDLKRNVSANTRWNDPAMFDLNSVRQQGVGGVGKLLTDAVPETKPLNRIYQGSGNLAERAGARADTGTPPFAHIVNRGLEGAAGAGLGYATHNPFLAAAPLLMDSVPVKTGAGYLLYHGGRAAGSLPNPAVASPLLLPQETR